MKIDDATDTIAKFFNDLIGSVVPGVVMTVGLGLIHLGPTGLRSLLQFGGAASGAFMFLSILFAVGHAVLALYEQILKKLIYKFRLVQPFDCSRVRGRRSFVWFTELLSTQRAASNIEDWSYTDLRNVALSVSAEAASVARRFMFISLLCQGVGTAMSILALDFLFCSWLSPKLLFPYDLSLPALVQVALLFCVACALFRNGEAFHRRAMTSPFAIAAAELKFKSNTDGK